MEHSEKKLKVIRIITLILLIASILFGILSTVFLALDREDYTIEESSKYYHVTVHHIESGLMPLFGTILLGFILYVMLCAEGRKRWVIAAFAAFLFEMILFYSSIAAARSDGDEIYFGYSFAITAASVSLGALIFWIIRLRLLKKGAASEKGGSYLERLKDASEALQAIKHLLDLGILSKAEFAEEKCYIFRLYGIGAAGRGEGGEQIEEITILETSDFSDDAVTILTKSLEDPYGIDPSGDDSED